MLECMRFEFSCIFVFFVAIYHQLQNGHKKAQESTKTAANMLECILEFSCVFVFFVAICHQVPIAIL